MGRRAKPSTDNPNEPATRLPPQRYALGLLTPKKDGCTITMLLARGVKVETIDELLAAGLAIKKREVVGRGRPIEITRIARLPTLDGERSNEARRFGAWSLCHMVPPAVGLGPPISEGGTTIA